LPPEIALLPTLKVVSLAGNSFAGTLHSELFEMSSLEKLELQANLFLTGTIPSNIIARINGRLSLLNLEKQSFQRQHHFSYNVNQQESLGLEALFLCLPISNRNWFGD
jgi:hypothetical protein